MSSRSSILIDIALSILLINNILLAVLLFSGKTKAEHNNNQNYQPLQFELSAQPYANILRSDVNEFLDIVEFNDESQDALIMLVPPYPCEGCLLEQCRIFNEFLHSNDIPSCIIITPNYHERDIKVNFPEKGVKVISYVNSDVLLDSIISHFDGLIFFTMKSHDVNDMFLSNKTFPMLTNNFLEHVL